MGETNQHITEKRKELAELEAIAGKVSNLNASLTPLSLRLLIETLEEGIQELIGKEVYDEKLGETFSASIEKLIKTVINIKPPVINNNVSVDLKPLVSEISQQNKSLISAVEKSNGNGGEVYNLVVSMLSKQNEIIDKLAASLSKPEVEKERPLLLKLKVIKDSYGKMELVPEYSKTK